VDCAEEDRFSSVDEAIECVRGELLEATRRRVRHAASSGEQVVADLSGGTDSRTILGLLSRLGAKADYYTFQYYQDESPHARAAFVAVGSPGRHARLEIPASTSVSDPDQLVWRFGGSATWWTTAICHLDTWSLRQASGGNAVRFTGLGVTDFLRKSPQPQAGTFASQWSRGTLFGLSASPSEACAILAGVKRDELDDRFARYVGEFRESTHDEQMKRYYFGYQWRIAWGPPEDRERAYLWGMTPMCAAGALRSVLKRFPNSWSSREVHLALMRSLDPRLTSTPFFGVPDLPSPKTLRGRIVRLKTELRRLLPEPLVSHLDRIRGRTVASYVPDQERRG
jgi:hypothetical protein